VDITAGTTLGRQSFGTISTSSKRDATALGRLPANAHRCH